MQLGEETRIMADGRGKADPPKSGREAVCNTCTIRLVRLAYQRAPWFRLVREPLRLGMRVMAAWHRIDPNEYEVRSQGCYGCMRFYKNALKGESAAFRWLNGRVNPLFDAVLERIVSPAEVQEAKAHARAAVAGGLPANESAANEKRR
jgi:hypothetical protein